MKRFIICDDCRYQAVGLKKKIEEYIRKSGETCFVEILLKSEELNFMLEQYKDYDATFLDIRNAQGVWI